MTAIPSHPSTIHADPIKPHPMASAREQGMGPRARMGPKGKDDVAP